MGLFLERLPASGYPAKFTRRFAEGIMKNGGRCLVSVLAGTIGVTGAWGVAAIGCGNGSSPTQVMGAPDATTEASANEDAQADVLVEGSAESANEDAQADVLAESSAETGAAPPGSDAGLPDVGPVVASPQAFPGQVAAALCNTIATCCGASADAATFNWQACYASKLGAGYFGSGTGSDLFDAGHVSFNATQAQDCLTAITAADCVSNQITSAEQAPLFQNCFAAYAGTLATGSPCAGTIECAPGNFCLPVDGGVGDAGAIGLCQVLAGDGGACAVLGANATVAQTVCSYRGSASNGLFCQNIAGDAGIEQLNAAAWTCQPQWATGSECYVTQDCSSFICHEVQTDLYQCGSAGVWANSTTCSSFLIEAGAPSDAGGGG
jgi:hypothetical protein